MSNIPEPVSSPLPMRMFNFLNAGDHIATKVPTDDLGVTCFVRIRPIAKPSVPREDHRYLNSTWSVWEYWDFEFRRFVLREGWELYERDYDHYIVQDERKLTHDSKSFESALKAWVRDVSTFEHVLESSCPE